MRDSGYFLGDLFLPTAKEEVPNLFNFLTSE